jgi:hypothetical protein
MPGHAPWRPLRARRTLTRTHVGCGRIINALADAPAPLGVEISELPMTPESLFRLIEKAQAQVLGG